MSALGLNNQHLRALGFPSFLRAVLSNVGCFTTEKTLSAVTYKYCTGLLLAGNIFQHPQWMSETAGCGV